MFRVSVLSRLYHFLLYCINIDEEQFTVISILRVVFKMLINGIWLCKCVTTMHGLGVSLQPNLICGAQRKQVDLTILRHPSQIRKVGKLTNSNFPQSLKPFLKLIGFSKSILLDTSDILDIENEEEKMTTRSRGREIESKRNALFENERVEDRDLILETSAANEKGLEEKAVDNASPEDDDEEDESESESSDDEIVYHNSPDRVKKPVKHVSFKDEPEVRYFSNLLIELQL